MNQMETTLTSTEKQINRFGKLLAAVRAAAAKQNIKAATGNLAKVAMTLSAVLMFAPVAHAAPATKGSTSTTTSSTSSTEANYDSQPAETGDFSVSLDTGIAFPLSRPQSDIFKMGGSQSVKGFFVINDYLDVGARASFLALPTKAANDDFGTAWGLGGTVRVKRPYNVPKDDKYYSISPWVDADALYVRTGNLNRPGVAVGTGLSVPVGETRSFRVGPYVRYLQIMQAKTDLNNRDAKIVSIGISIEVGNGVERRGGETTESVTTTTNTYYCADKDRDDVPDNVDHCPDVAGPVDHWGCPNYKKVVVKKDKLELKEKLYFAWDEATLEEASFPILDDVVQALKDSKGFKVQVEGHADSSGADDHNQTLSEKRAEAVLDYLAAHGIKKERLISKGFSSSVPLDTNKTAEGRENNRRVEFVVSFIIVKEGKK